MAYDPEARRQSNSAMIIAVVSALILGGGLLAWLATRNTTPETGPTTVITTPGRERTVVVNNTVAVPVPVPGTPEVVVRDVPSTVIVQPAAPSTSTTKVIERNSTTVRDRVVAPRPATGSASTNSGSTGSATNSGAAPVPQSNTNVTINNAPPATKNNMDNAASNGSAASSGSETAPATGTASNSAGY